MGFSSSRPSLTSAGSNNEIRAARLNGAETEWDPVGETANPSSPINQSGSGDARVLVRHVLPNVLTPVIVLVTLGIPAAIVAGAALSFLGLGVKPPTPDWGEMLSKGRAFMGTAWWLSTFPGLAIAVVVLAINRFGDGLRDALDPRLKL